LKYFASALKPICVVAVLLIVPTETNAQQTCSGLNYYPAVVIPGGQPQAFFYCESSSSQPSPDLDLPVHLKNASSLTIEVRGINPLVRTFTVSTSGTPYTEVSGSSLMSLLSIPSPTATSPPGGSSEPPSTNLATQTSSHGNEGGGPAAQPTSQIPCLAQYESTDPVTSLQNQVAALAALVNAYQKQVTDAQAAYLQAVSALEKEVSPDGSHPSQSEFQAVANALNLATAQSLSTVPGVTANNAGQYLTSYEGKNFVDVATAISAQATQLSGTLQVPPNCSAQDVPQVQKQISADQAFLSTLFSPAGTSNSKMAQLQSEASGSAAAAVTLATNIGSLQQIAADPQNFEIDFRIPPEDRVQTAVVVTVSWTNKALPSCVAAPSTQTSTPTASPSGGAQSQQPTAPAGCPAPTSASRTFTVSFGQGPRTFESAGFAFSKLPQPSYATAAVGSSAGCPSTVQGTAQTGCIVNDAGNGWRILPIALATVRFADVPWSDWRFLLPNYFSFGATIKSNSSGGADIEYLMGPSWTSPGQHIFVTGGAYAGEETVLTGGLSAGPQVIAPPSTLPTATPYRWKFGFAISYAFGSQGGTTSQVQSQPTSTGNQPTAQPTQGGANPPQS
jgi:hypothetical protein